MYKNVYFGIVFNEHKGGNRFNIHQQMNYIMVLAHNKILKSNCKVALNALSEKGIHDVVFNTEAIYTSTCVICMWLLFPF